MADGDRLVLGLAVGMVLLSGLFGAESNCLGIMLNGVVLCDLEGVVTGRPEWESGWRIFRY